MKTFMVNTPTFEPKAILDLTHRVTPLHVVLISQDQQLVMVSFGGQWDWAPLCIINLASCQKETQFSHTQ